MSKLKNCPFCGCDMSNVKPFDYDPFDGYQGNNVRYIISCLNCSAKITERNPAEAIEAWNKRVPQTEVHQYGNNCIQIENSGTLDLNLL